jgi:hypothetical protein
MERNADTCLTCKFTKEKTGGSLTCLRYPTQTRVARTQWCGEWQADKIPTERRKRAAMEILDPVLSKEVEE